jgi:ribulose-bisphosphate carboxylase large chain
LHIGTVIGKLDSPLGEVVALKDNLQKRIIHPTQQLLGQNWNEIKPVFPTCSGGLHPGQVPQLIRLLGTNIIIQAGGGIWGHPDGGKAGAVALRQAIEASRMKIPVAEYAKIHKELRIALKTWGTGTFK